MGPNLLAHELDALDFAAIWPLGGQSSVAPVNSATQTHASGKEARREPFRGGR